MMSLYDLCGLPFGWIMRLIYMWVDNYALAIVIFTIFTKLILFPIAYKQQINMARMQRINPKLEKLRKKYKDDQQKMQEAQMKLYQEENVNSGSSCLPMFLQFFILFGILDVVYKPLTYILKIDDSIIDKAFDIVEKVAPDVAKQGSNLRQELSIMNVHNSNADAFGDVFAGSNISEKISEFYDKFTIFGVNLGDIPTWKPETWNYSAVVLFMIPVMAGLLQLVLTVYSQMKAKKRNPSQAKQMGYMNGMLYIMPLFSVWFAFNVPAGVGFYWVCSSFFSLIQTIGLNLYMTPERVEKICKKQDEKNTKKYANGKKNFMQRMMDMQNGPTEAQQKRAQYAKDTENLSRSELTKYNNQVLQEARQRYAEKYGDAIENEAANENDEK